MAKIEDLLPNKHLDKYRQRRKLYNLTLHRQIHLEETLDKRDWEVEVEPRLVPIKNPQDWTQIKRVVRMAALDIPPGSAVLVGGMTQIAILISQMYMYDLFYIKLTFDRDRTIPSGICPHIGWTNEELANMRVIKMGEV